MYFTFSELCECSPYSKRKAVSKMSTSITHDTSNAIDPQVAIRRARKAQQRSTHRPRSPNGKAARAIRAEETMQALSKKFASMRTEFRLALDEALEAYAKSKPRGGWTPLQSAFGVIDRKYSTALTPSEIKVMKIAIRTELTAH